MSLYEKGSDVIQGVVFAVDLSLGFSIDLQKVLAQLGWCNLFKIQKPLLEMECFLACQKGLRDSYMHMPAFAPLSCV